MNEFYAIKFSHYRNALEVANNLENVNVPNVSARRMRSALSEIEREFKTKSKPGYK